jgi:ferredoxin-type protein NapG
MPDLDRRAFFKRGFKKVAKTAVNYADKKVSKQAHLWIRPPYAINELEFLMACTRCGDCIKACEHNSLFSLPAQYGATVVNTPVMDLKNSPCHMCDDWHCVSACEPMALKLPLIINGDVENEALAEDIKSIPLPKMALVKIDTSTCLPFLGPECGACRFSCKVEGALKWDLTKPVIDETLCTGCGLCRQACITQPSSISIIHRTKSLEETE